MAASPYYARYCTFQTSDKSDGGFLLSADSLIGDLFEIVFEVEEGRRTAYLRNRFGHTVGYFDRDVTHKLLLCQADGWDIHAVLSAVFFSEKGNSGYYWGEVALICYAKRYADEFETFTEGVCKQLRSGRRPMVELNTNGVQKVIDSKGTWAPSDREPKRKLQPGTIVVKDSLRIDEHLIEMARNKNIGCMIIGWAFILALIALALYIVWLILPF